MRNRSVGNQTSELSGAKYRVVSPCWTKRDQNADKEAGRQSPQGVQPQGSERNDRLCFCYSEALTGLIFQSDPPHSKAPMPKAFYVAFFNGRRVEKEDIRALLSHCKT